MPQYDHPQYLVLRECLKEPHAGAITAAAATGGLLGSTFRTYNKAAVYGVAAICSTGGSGGTGVITVAVVRGGTTVSLTTNVLSPVTLVAAASTILTFTSPITLSSIGECVLLHGSSSAAGDIAELGTVIWRYRHLPTAASTDVVDDFTSTVLG